MLEVEVRTKKVNPSRILPEWKATGYLPLRSARSKRRNRSYLSESDELMMACHGLTEKRALRKLNRALKREHKKDESRFAKESIQRERVLNGEHLHTMRIP